jgi:hypothetical protein
MVQLPTKRTWALIGVVALIAFAAGLSTGFDEGYLSAVHSSSADAAVTAMELKLLKSGDLRQAQGLLEQNLDGLLISNNIGRHAHWFSPVLLSIFPDGPDNIDRLFGQGATYRLQNPRHDDVTGQVRSVGEQAARGILERNGSRLKN